LVPEKIKPSQFTDRENVGSEDHPQIAIVYFCYQKAGLTLVLLSKKRKGDDSEAVRKNRAFFHPTVHHFNEMFL
jgi:hypothetical protein